MSEIGLGRLLTRRFGRLLWAALATYALFVIGAFGVVSELALRRSLEQAADVIESLLGLYADPAGERTTVAPAMLADQFLGMGQRFVITRAVATDGGGSTVYYLSPTMPAQEIQLPAGATPAEARAHIARAIASRGGGRYRVQHRASGEFDIFVAAGRGPYALAILGLVAAALVLLPVAALLARRATGRVVTAALEPLADVVATTKSIDPQDLTRRIASPTGVAEVTELVDEINRMIERVERAHRALEGFTADVSHELRTPLTHLRAQAQWALEEHRDAEDMREGLAAISQQVELTTKMVEDLLLIARGENAQLSLDRQPFDLQEILHEVEEVTAAMAAGKGLAVRATSGGPSSALGDPNRTRQILLNLASNAVRYTESGSVTFDLVRDDGSVGVAVRDTGCGIAPEQIDRVFDRFYRVEESRSRAHGGAGLGLTIARLLAVLQGGRITVSSMPGDGSTFHLWLPAVPEPSESCREGGVGADARPAADARTG